MIVKKTIIVYSILLTLIAVGSSLAQQKTALQIVESLKNPSKTNKTKVYYSPGYEKRALQLQAMIEEAVKFYERKLDIKQEINIAVLTPEQWRQVGSQVPYGVPNVQGPPYVIFMAATTDNATTQATMSLKEKTSAATLKKIKASGFRFEQGAIESGDQLALHELGHVLTRTFGINPANKWFSEFLATYFAYAYMKDHKPKQARLWEAMSYAYIDGIEPKYTALADFERLYFGVGLDNYGWYQAKFLLKGAEIQKKGKLQFLKKIKKSFPLTEKEPVSLETTLERLEKISPGFKAWSKELK